MQTAISTDASIGLGQGVCSAAEPLDQWPGRWWLIAAKTGKDNRIASELRGNGVKVFMPTERYIRLETRGGVVRRHKEERLLFRGYVFFAAASDEDRYIAAKSLHKISIIPIINQKRTISELANFQRAMLAGVAMTMHNRLVAGQEVTIVKHPIKALNGFKAKIVKNHEGHLFLNIRDLCMSHSFECSSEYVELLN